jgi:hypothetical protein
VVSRHAVAEDSSCRIVQPRFIIGGTGILLVLITLMATMAHAQSGNSGIAGVVDTVFGQNWLRPTQIQQGRWAKLGLQFDF